LRLLNDREDGYRMIVRTYIRNPIRFGDEWWGIAEKNEAIDTMNRDMNSKKFDRCMKIIFDEKVSEAHRIDEKISEAHRIDCENFVRVMSAQFLEIYFEKNNIQVDDQQRYRDKIDELSTNFL